MIRYVAFLKGVNVGGHNIITKEKLREAFTELGYHNVCTFKQSGNVFFEIDATDAEGLEEKIQKRLLETTGKNIAVRVRTIAELEDILKFDPFKSQNKEGASFLVTFLPRGGRKGSLQVPAKISKSTAEVIAIQGEEVYSVSHGHGDGALPNPFIELKLKVVATTRNWNIINEIVQKYSNKRA